MEVRQEKGGKRRRTVGTRREAGMQQQEAGGQAEEVGTNPRSRLRAHTTVEIHLPGLRML